DDAGGLSLPPGGGVLVQRALGSSLVEPAHELAVAGADRVGVPALRGLLEAPHQGFRRRAPAEVLDSLPGREANALFLLSDGRHRVKTPASRGLRDGSNGRKALRGREHLWHG